MPVILPTRHYKAWLDPDAVAPDELTKLLVPYEANKMHMELFDSEKLAIRRQISIAKSGT